LSPLLARDANFDDIHYKLVAKTAIAGTLDAAIPGLRRLAGVITLAQ